MIVYSDPWLTILEGEALEQLRTLPDESVQCAITSPPFFGSGTVGLVAERYGRRTIGIEMNPDYIEQAKKRIAQGRSEGTGAPLDMDVPAPSDSLWEQPA
jgi:DNA modification methylase